MTSIRIAIAGVLCVLLATSCDNQLTDPTPIDPIITRPPVVTLPPELPRPVDLGIRNILQETQVWCWAAVAQQIILHLRGPNDTPPQCALVAIAYNAGPEYCCNAPQACLLVGNIQQIQLLIGHFGGRYSSIAAPTDPMTVYNTLASGRPIIMLVRSSPTGNVGHFIVIRGMEWRATPFGGEPVLYVNDPLSYYTQPIPFAQIARIWQNAIVVY